MSERLKVYIAGPYRSRWGIMGRAYNIWRAWRAARFYWRNGCDVFCPHLNSAFMDGTAPDDVFLRQGVRHLTLCNVIAVDGDRYRISSGTQLEMEWAALFDIKQVWWGELPT